MQLRGNINNVTDEPLELTNRDDLEHDIECLRSSIGAHLLGKGVTSIEVTKTNFGEVACLLTPQVAFLLGRLVALQQLHEELFGGRLLFPWIKNPENN